MYEIGFYWVWDKFDEKWRVAEFNGIEWEVSGCDGSFSTGFISTYYDIGEIITKPQWEPKEC